ncbi:DUF294 nucleotidyltransferase-like domain-containing protein [Metabacillus herbersteinensis]|uniref:DUF294 nucleotidyltransferase-like domain-containing protein n=1 Tax=Metabacillus herbersteinensis TaxID=283816 RepID=A0ABV6GLH1_9BACI
MNNKMEHFEVIKKWKNEHIRQFQTDTNSLNAFHDNIMCKVFEIALQSVTEQFGETPCDYSWFVMGSAGRYEQGIFSDQDHGIVYEKTCEQTAIYFKELGKQLAVGLNHVGYPFCEGNVMSSNPVWCKSYKEWGNQLIEWMKKESWDSIRYLQIFHDARSLVGKSEYIDQLKSILYHFHKNNPSLLIRFLDNVMLVKPSVGPLGQIFVEDKGPHSGSIDLKRSGFFPYVNSIRLLAIKEEIKETTTLSRIDSLCTLPSYLEPLEKYREHFSALLNYRISLFEHANSYDDIHYLSVASLSQIEKNEVKDILKNGKKLHQFVQRIVKKGYYDGV